MISKWEIVCGDSTDPEYWEKPEELGMGRGDAGAQAQAVLRKWWTGQ